MNFDASGELDDRELWPYIGTFQAEIVLPPGATLINVTAVATVDQYWRQQSGRTAPASTLPQSHMVNARTLPSWSMENNGHRVVGRISWSSKTVTFSEPQGEGDVGDVVQETEDGRGGGVPDKDTTDNGKESLQQPHPPDLDPSAAAPASAAPVSAAPVSTAPMPAAPGSGHRPTPGIALGSQDEDAVKKIALVYYIFLASAFGVSMVCATRLCRLSRHDYSELEMLDPV
jgi:hypothetical protein